MKFNKVLGNREKLETISSIPLLEIEFLLKLFFKKFKIIRKNFIKTKYRINKISIRNE